MCGVEPVERHAGPQSTSACLALRYVLAVAPLSQGRHKEEQLCSKVSNLRAVLHHQAMMSLLKSSRSTEPGVGATLESVSYDMADRKPLAPSRRVWHARTGQPAAVYALFRRDSKPPRLARCIHRHVDSIRASAGSTPMLHC